MIVLAVAFALVRSGLCIKEPVPGDRILVVNTIACENCDIMVNVPIEDIVPVNSLTACLWLNPSYFYGFTSAFSIWSEYQYCILTVNVQDDTIEVSGVSSDFFPVTKIAIGEWIHLSIMYGTFLSVVITIPGENNQRVFAFYPPGLNIQNGSKLITIVGANSEEDDPMYGRFADIRIYWRLLTQDEVAKVSSFDILSEDFLSVLDLMVNDPNNKDKYEYDREGDFGINEGEGARKIVSFNNIEVSTILKPHTEHFFWFFDSNKMSCENGKKLCTRLGGTMFNEIENNTLKNLLDEFMRTEGNSDSFWVLSSKGNCIKGRYKNNNIATTVTNVTKLHTICLLSKKQNFFLLADSNNYTFLAAPEKDGLFKSKLMDRIINYVSCENKAYIKSIIDPEVWYETKITAAHKFMGRHNWTRVNSEMSYVRFIFTICTLGQFTCSNGDCVDMSKVCDYLNDCSDDSDEDFCEIGVPPQGFYDRRAAPLIEDGLLTKVSFDVILTKVGSIDMDSNTIDLNLLVTAKWRDPRLKFKYLTENKTQLVAEEIAKLFWSPKVTMVTAISRHIHKFDMNKYPENIYTSNAETPKLEVFKGYEAYIFYGNNVDISSRKNGFVTFMCDMDLFLYPFDSQKCNITFVIEGMLTPDVVWDSEGINVYVHQRRHPTLFNSLKFFLSGPLPKDSTEVEVESTESIICGGDIFINPGPLIGHADSYYENKAYVLTTFLPFVLLLIIGLMTFLMPWDDYQDRLTVTLSSLFVMATLFTQISSSLPETSEPKMIDIWMFSHVSLLFLVFMFNVAVIRVHKGATDPRSLPQYNRVPRRQSKRPNMIGDLKNPSVSKMVFLEKSSDDDDDATESSKLYVKMNRFALIFCTVIYTVFLLTFFYIALWS